MKIRPLLGILAGLVAWWVAFYASTAVFTFVWPALAEAGRPAVESNDFTRLTTPMLLLFIAMYFWVNPLAGWVTVFITKNRKHAWFTAIPLLLYAGVMHFYVLWNNLPDWYNVAVPVLIPPLVYGGGLLARSAGQR